MMARGALRVDIVTNIFQVTIVNIAPWTCATPQ